jgi:hypothetical protein
MCDGVYACVCVCAYNNITRKGSRISTLVSIISNRAHGKKKKIKRKWENNINYYRKSLFIYLFTFFFFKKSNSSFCVRIDKKKSSINVQFYFHVFLKLF